MPLCQWLQFLTDYTVICRGVVLTPHPHLQYRGLKLGRAIPLSALRDLVTYTGRIFTFTPLSENSQTKLGYP
jgi:hypothetical protein